MVLGARKVRLKEMSDLQKSEDELSAAAKYTVDYARDQIAGKNVVVLTGAGLSTDSGIPDYRGAGRVARHPMTFDVFLGSPAAQQRYWARSYVGYNRIAEATPNRGHYALAAAEAQSKVSQIITQNVDALHERAGSKKVIDLHGRLDRVRCMGCGAVISRAAVDDLLFQLNPTVTKDVKIEFTPDGDAEIEATADFLIPSCPSCGGVLKPDVVFFGESVPVSLVEQAMSALDSADVLVVAGTSLTVNSGMRFAKRAQRASKPIIIVNLGETKADSIALAKIEANTSLALERLFLD